MKPCTRTLAGATFWLPSIATTRDRAMAGYAPANTCSSTCLAHHAKHIGCEIVSQHNPASHEHHISNATAGLFCGKVRHRHCFGGTRATSVYNIVRAHKATNSTTYKIEQVLVSQCILQSTPHEIGRQMRVVPQCGMSTATPAARRC
jgi:hypothetical protein